MSRTCVCSSRDGCKCQVDKIEQRKHHIQQLYLKGLEALSSPSLEKESATERAAADAESVLSYAKRRAEELLARN